MSPRNIVVILCDQLRPDFLNIYGCKAVPTPNIDGLARKGVVFKNAITQSTVCAPARASMMTGRYVSDHMVWTNDVPFREDVNYIPEKMNDLDYVTGAFGKLHHFPPEDVKGFQYAKLMEEGRLDEDEPYLEWLKQKYSEVSNIWNIEGDQFKYSEEEYHEHWIASRAINFIEEQVHNNKDQPFLSWVSFQGPHTPLDPPESVKGTVDESELPEPISRRESEPAPVTKLRETLADYKEMSEKEIMKRRKKYAELIVEIDKQIGRILQNIKSLGIMDNTTFIFSADHGDLLGDFNLGEKGPFPYRGQLEIPLIISNHPEIAEGEKTDTLVGNIDIPGTVLDIAGSEESIGVSRSLLEQAQPNPENPREVNFSEFCDSIKTVENKRYRFSYYPFTGFTELYDKEKDPDEQNNLSGHSEYRELEQEMLKHIIDFGVVSKGVRVEAHDFALEQQEGVRKKYPDFEKDFKVVFPLSRQEVKKLNEAGLPSDYNEFMKDMEILNYYSQPYWR